MSTETKQKIETGSNDEADALKKKLTYVKKRGKRQISSIQKELSKKVKIIESSRNLLSKWINILDRMSPVDEQTITQMIRDMKAERSSSEPESL
jgi:hypothetical protein